MRRSHCIAALLATAMHCNPAIAADTVTSPDATKTVYAIASHTENQAFEYSARKALGFVSDARIAIGNRYKEAATSYIDEALREVDSIRNTRNYLEMMGVTFGRVLYGETGSYYIPIADDTYAVRSYAQGPFWSDNKTSAVRDVELVNVNIAINPELAMTHLQTARQKIASDAYKVADKELKSLLDESIHQTASTPQPFTRLQDNIYLTRILLRQQNYDGARYTLQHARAALDDYEKTVTTQERHADADAMRRDIDALDSTIKQHNPSLLEKSSGKVEQWWNDLKKWARDKTS